MSDDSIFVELMKTTMTLSQHLNISPFEIFDRDCDEVIMLINFYIMLGENKNTKTQTTAKSSKNDGFWDF